MATHRNLSGVVASSPPENPEIKLENVNFEVKTETQVAPNVSIPEDNFKIKVESKLLDKNGNEVVKPAKQPTETISFANFDIKLPEVPSINFTEFDFTELSVPDLKIDLETPSFESINFKLSDVTADSPKIQIPTFTSESTQKSVLTIEKVTQPTLVIPSITEVVLPGTTAPQKSVVELAATGGLGKIKEFFGIVDEGEVRPDTTPFENKINNFAENSSMGDLGWLSNDFTKGIYAGGEATAWALEFSSSIVTQWNREKQQEFSNWLSGNRDGWNDWLGAEMSGGDFWLGHAGNKILDFIEDSAGLYFDTTSTIANLYSNFSNSVNKQISDTLYADKMGRKRLKVARPQYEKGTNDSWGKLWNNVAFWKKKEKSENKEEEKAEKEEEKAAEKDGLTDPRATIPDDSSFLLFTHIMNDLDAQLQYYIMYFTTRNLNGDEQLLKVPAHYIKRENGKVEKLEDEDYFYYFYINSINFKPYSGQTSSVNYGPFKLKTRTFTGSKNENTFTLKTSMDMGLSFYDYVSQKCMGLVWENGLISSQMRGNGFYMNEKATADQLQTSRVDMHIVVHSKTTKVDNKKQFYVNRFILKDIIFNKLSNLDFNQNGNKMDVQMSGIYRKCYFVHNELLPQN